MTVATTASRVSYSGNGSTTAFSFPYEYRAQADLKVVIVSSANVATLKTLTTHYTVSGVSDSHGGYSSATVTMVTAPASGETLVIYRSPSIVQESDVESESDPLYAINNALDLATYALQHLENDKLGLPLGVTESFSNKLPDLPDDDGVTYYLGPSSDRTSLSWLTLSSTAQTISSAWLPVVTAGTLASGLSLAGLGTEDSPTFTGLSLTSLTVTGTTAATHPAIFKNTADNANVAALRLEGDRATMANNDKVYQSFYLSDSAGNQDEFGRLTCIATDVTSTSEDAQLWFGVVVAGTLDNKVSLGNTAMQPLTNDGIALGTSSLSWSDLFLASGAVISFNAGNYTITHTAGVLTTNGAFKSTSTSGGLGYATGAGGAITQQTDKSTGVTLDKICGQITMNNATLNAAAEVGFTLTNSAIGATDVVIVNIATTATANSYQICVDAVAAGSCHITLTNTSASNLGEALVLNFAVIKAVAA